MKAGQEVRLFSLEKGKFCKNLTVVFQFLVKESKRTGEGLLTQVCSDRTRANGFKLKKVGSDLILQSFLPSG